MKPLHLGYNANGQPIRLKPDDRKTHMHVIGSSGSGKSKFLEWMIRGDLRNRQGFCLIDPHGTLYNDVLHYCAHKVLDREIILLNLSQPDNVIGFNPFHRAEVGDVSVQVDRRIDATMHAWNIENTDETPTLARTLKLIYTVMLEQNLGLPQVQHLIDFNSLEIRSHLIEKLQSPLIQKEWRELQQLRTKDWREEIRSAKNKLFKFLTSTTLARFIGVPGRTLNLKEIMDEGKILLVNLAPSDHLSHENSRAFGALLVNEFFETALRRRDDRTRSEPKPYYLYMDEFQNFVGLDIDNMLDETRKFALFLVLAHQRFSQLDETLVDAVLTHCKIKAVFGGLPVESARRMAEEMFIRKLDPKKIKVAIYQTKFWPEYRRDKSYARSAGSASGSGWSEGTTSGSSYGNTSGEYFQAGDWLNSNPAGTSSSQTYGTSSMSGSSYSTSQSYSESESEIDIPIFFPVPFQELSSVQYYTPEEQLLELTAALKEQYGRHCFIKIHNQETQPMLVPFVKQFHTSQKNSEWYKESLLTKQNALPGPEVDRLIESQDHALLIEAQTSPIIDVEASPLPAKEKSKRRTTKSKPNIFKTIKDDPIGRE